MKTFKEWRGNNGSAQFPAAGAYVSNARLNEDEEYEDEYDESEEDEYDDYEEDDGYDEEDSEEDAE